MGMLDREARKVRAKVIPNVKRETLQNEILNHVQRGCKVYTDKAIRLRPDLAQGSSSTKWSTISRSTFAVSPHARHRELLESVQADLERNLRCG